MRHRFVIALAAILCCLLNISDGGGIHFKIKPGIKYDRVDGNRFSLPCKAESPDGDRILYKWLWNDLPLIYDGYRIWHAHSHNLDMKYTKPKHSGKYVCVAYTTGERRSEASVSTVVHIHEKLKFVNKPEKKDISVIEGASLRLPCKVNRPDNDNIKYAWYFDYYPLKYDDNRQWRSSDHELLLKSVQVKDSGIYVCRVNVYKPIWTRVGMEVHLIIHEKLKIVKRPEKTLISIIEGDSLRLPCKANNPDNGHISYKWLLNGSILKYDDHRKWWPSHHELLLKSAQVKHSGIYTCKTNTIRDTASMDINITIHEKLRIVKRPAKTHINIIEGDSLQMPCKANYPDNGHISYKWFLNGSSLRYDNHKEWRSSHHELFLKSVQVEDSGNYTCTVDSTFAGKASMDIYITVHEKLKIVKRPEKSHISIIEGDSLRLPCKANYPDNDDISYKWILNGSLLKYDDHREWWPSHHELLLKSVKVKDSGIYTCKVDSTLDTASMDIDITVYEKLRIVKRPAKTHINIVEGDSLRLPCKANYPDDGHVSYKWLLNGSSLRYENHKEWRSSHHELLLKFLQVEDSGNYTCTVDSTFAGKASMDIHITVHEKLNIIKRPEKSHISIIEGDSLRLPCKANYPDNDDISYKWALNGSLLKYDDHREWWPSHHELLLKSVKVKDSGIYTCKVDSALDTASIDINIRVHEKLRIVKRPETTQISIVEGDSLRLPCKANYPDSDHISYKWFFNCSVLIYDSNREWWPSYHELLLKSVQMNHSGIYKCTVDSTLDRASMDVNITVYEDLLANKCPPSVVLPTHHSVRNVTWTPPYAQDRTGILKHIKVHPSHANPPFEAPLGDTNIKYTLVLENGQESSCSFKITVFEGIKIVKGPESKEYNVAESGSLSLSCKAISKDKDHISYKWLFNGSPLNYDYHILWQDNSHELHLKNVVTKQSGKYTCVAYTTGERKSKALVSTNVNIYEKVKIIKRPKKTQISIFEGDSLRLPCKANYPDDGSVSYTWLLNGSLLKYDSHRKWPTSQHELVLLSLQVKDSGIYTCKVDTVKGWDSASVDIHVTVLDGLSSEKDLLANKCPPSVVLPTHHSVRNVTWTPPYAQDRTDILKHIKVHPSHANPPFEAPLGDTHIKYTLALANGQETSCSFKITVFRGIYFKIKPGIKYDRVDGNKFSLPCKAESPDRDPISYKWLWNDLPLRYDNYRAWKGNELDMMYTKPKHSGKYTCVAYTTGERKSKASAGTVINIHEKLKFINKSDIRHLTIVEGESLRLPCKANYPDNGHISYKWFLNDSSLKYDNHRVWRPHHHELLLKSVQVKHSGKYECRVNAYKPIWRRTFLDFHITVQADNYSFTAWSGWSKCSANSGSNIGHRSRFRTCVSSSRNVKSPGKCSGTNNQVEICDIKKDSTTPPPTTKTSTPSPSPSPSPSPTPTDTGFIILTRPDKGPEAIKAVKKDSPSKSKSKFFDTFYGKLAIGSSLAILVVILGCAVFVLVGHKIEKKDKKRRRGYRPVKTVEEPPFNEGPSKEEEIDNEDEMDRKAFEKRRVIKELTPKNRKRSELDDDLVVARAIILEEGVNKDHEREVTEKRKKVVKTTSSTACKKSLLESINSSRAIIMDKGPTQSDNVDRASVSFQPPRITSAGSSRESSFHSLDETKNTQNENDDEDSLSMMMVQPVQPVSFEAKQATIKHAHDFDLNP